MKGLIITVGAVCLLLLCALLIGALLPKRHVVSRSATYAQKPEQLFGLVSGSQSWRLDIARAETVLGPEGRTLLRETDRRGRTITYEMLDIHPPRKVSRRIVDRDLPYAGTWTYSLQPNGAATRLTITEDGEIYNPAFRFLARFIIGHTSTINAYLLELGRATGEQVIPTDAG